MLGAFPCSVVVTDVITNKCRAARRDTEPLTLSFLFFFSGVRTFFFALFASLFGFHLLSILQITLTQRTRRTTMMRRQQLTGGIACSRLGTWSAAPVAAGAKDPTHSSVRAAFSTTNRLMMHA